MDTEEDGKCNGHATRLYKLPQVETVINDLKGLKKAGRRRGKQESKMNKTQDRSIYFSQEDTPDKDTQMDTGVVTIYEERNKHKRHFYFFDDERNAWF